MSTPLHEYLVDQSNRCVKKNKNIIAISTIQEVSISTQVITANKSKSWRGWFNSGDLAKTTNKKGARESFEK